MLIGHEKVHATLDAFLEVLDEDCDDDVVGAVMLIVEVKVKGDPPSSAFHTFCSDPRIWIQKAMLSEASDVVEWVSTARLDDEDADE